MSRFSTIPMWRQNRSSIRAAMASVTLLLLAGLLDACGDRQEQSPASPQPAHRPAPIRPATSRDFPPFSSLLAEAVDTLHTAFIAVDILVALTVVVVSIVMGRNETAPRAAA